MNIEKELNKLIEELVDRLGINETPARKDYIHSALEKAVQLGIKEVEANPIEYIGVVAIDSIAKEQEKVVLKEDVVNHPSHYKMLPDLESIDAIEGALTPPEFMGFLKGNFMKYRFRAGEKDDLKQDIDKSNWYKNKAYAWESSKTYFNWSQMMAKWQKAYNKNNQEEIPHNESL